MPNDPKFNSTATRTQLLAKEALKALADQGDLYAHHGNLCAHDSAFTHLAQLIDEELKRERNKLSADRERVTAGELLRQGGEWLGAARNWIQWHRRNGSDVTWGSNDVLEPPMTVANVEDLAAEVAAVAMAPQPSEKQLETRLRAQWDAQRDVTTLKRDLTRAVEALKEALPVYAAEGWRHPHGRSDDEWAAEVKRLRSMLADLTKVVTADTKKENT